MRKLNTETFKERAIIKHGSLYDYSLVEYVGSNIKIKIICKSHGVFEQIPNNHLIHGFGCFKCKNEKQSITQLKYNKDFFLNKAKSIHDIKYDYTKVDYYSMKIKIKIICKIHGDFEQTPMHHLKGQGCIKCSYTNRNLNRKGSTEEFINKACKIHGDLFDYSSVEYENRYKKIKILCKKHNKLFEQTPGNHIHGKAGCPLCNESKGEKETSLLLKSLNIKFEREFSFDDCKDFRKLRFDFYLPEYNICIEYDGKQHYEAYSKFGGEKALTDIKRKDSIKTNYCLSKNIKLIRISYKDNIKNSLKFLQQMN